MIDELKELGLLVADRVSGGNYHLKLPNSYANKSVSFKYNNNYIIKFEENIGGCGTVTMFGNAYFELLPIEVWNLLCAYLKSTNVGAITAILGANYFKKPHEKMLEYGFEQVAEYVNYQHDSNYLQRLYIKKL